MLPTDSPSPPGGCSMSTISRLMIDASIYLCHHKDWLGMLGVSSCFDQLEAALHRRTSWLCVVQAGLVRQLMLQTRYTSDCGARHVGNSRMVTTSSCQEAWITVKHICAAEFNPPPLASLYPARACQAYDKSATVSIVPNISSSYNVWGRKGWPTLKNGRTLIIAANVVDTNHETKGHTTCR